MLVEQPSHAPMSLQRAAQPTHGLPPTEGTYHSDINMAQVDATSDVARTTHDASESESPRGRRRSREGDGEDDVRMADDGGSEEAVGANGRSRKRRRSRKGLDKKFDCRYENCGKSYSRAEHLSRHELNHNPKRRYFCDFPDCDRNFVRQDLCTRHKERHTARGSQLQRKETYIPNSSTSPTTQIKNEAERDFDHRSSAQLPLSRPKEGFAEPVPRINALVYPSPTETKHSTLSPTSASSSATLVGSGLPNSTAQQDSKGMSAYPTVGKVLKRSDSDSSYRADSIPRSFDSPTTSRSTPASALLNGQRHANFDSMNMNTSTSTAAFPQPLRASSMGGAETQTLSQQPQYTNITSSHLYNRPTHATTLPTHGYQQPTASFSYQTPQSLTQLPPAVNPYPTMAHTPQARPSSGSLLPTSLAESNAIDHKQTYAAVTSAAGTHDIFPMDLPVDYTIPVFGGNTLTGRSPLFQTDDFVTWLGLVDSNYGTSPLGRSGGPGPFPNFMDGPGGTTGFFHHDSMMGYANQSVPQHFPMAVNSILDTSMPESELSEDKRETIMTLIRDRFNQKDHSATASRKERLLEGDQNDDTHVLSLGMMKQYIKMFWWHFHPQLPLLHKPTFVADETHELLLLAMMAIGASCLDRGYRHQLTEDASELSNFLAWHLRWEIFSDAAFSPPAKLWIFQALLLLEIYEKMYSTRALHERAHIHHATTLTLMRRGSSLIGRSALDSPPSAKDDKTGHGSESSTTASGANTPDEIWNHWIISEATRRAAFAAFVMDSTHATMFGHNAVMVAHEMRLHLPCDEALWSATSSAEVARVEASLNAAGVKPTTFLDGLKKTLNNQPVRTNSFGRTVLMAGLLSVSWHMNQRDLSVSSIGVAQALGGRDRWRTSLTRAFDAWKRDFDNAAAFSSSSGSSSYQPMGGLSDDNVFEGRTVLHHLAHMAMHVDIVDCQIFARASRLLGRTIGSQDYQSAGRRMREVWAPTARARDATFYALQFLSQVLNSTDQGYEYVAREDFLLNRPWVLYFAALIVWSYGYALEGPIAGALPPLNTPEQKRADMRKFMHRVGSVQRPDDLADMRERNCCAGLLLVLRDMFMHTRWELLCEGSKLLTNCVDMLLQTDSA